LTLVLSLFVLPPPPRSPLFPYTTLFRSQLPTSMRGAAAGAESALPAVARSVSGAPVSDAARGFGERMQMAVDDSAMQFNGQPILDRKSTRLNSSHVKISYAVFCLKKKK